MREFSTELVSLGQIDAALSPAAADVARKQAAVDEIVARVRAEGDAAVLEYVRKFDWPEATLPLLKVTEAEFSAALSEVDAELMTAMTVAAEHIRQFHQRQLPENFFEEIEWGLRVGQRHTPVESVACYVPTGKASIPSSLLMSVVPALVAGVPRIVVVGPSLRDGTMPAGVLVAAHLLGITEIYKLGSAWALAALAFGTPTFPKVDKIVGPTSMYGSLAKKALYGEVGIDGLYGPSEVVIIADGSVPADWVAADLLSQSEHGEDSQSVLISPDADYLEAVKVEIAAQLAASPRAKYLEVSLRERGALVLTRDLAEAAEMANVLAAEHLELAVANPEGLLPLIKHAGSILMGAYTPVPVGDYLAGPSHILPTGRTARFSSGLGVTDFLKRSSLVQATPEWLRENRPTIATLATHEGLAAHADTVARRVK